MENNQTLVERLREYAENGPFNLISFIEVATGSITDSYKVVAEKFADQIEAETLPRPRFSNGEIVDIGDEIIYDARPFEVMEIAVNNSGRYQLTSNMFEDTAWIDKKIHPVKFKRDTKEGIIYDAKRTAEDYWGCGEGYCSNCPAKINGQKPNEYYGVDNCVKAMTLELLNRFEKVIEGEGDSDE